jgi:phospho-N-acetylmuramoyl-pentapeptide-transferase
MIFNVLKVFGLASFSFFLAIFLTPIFTHYFYKYKMWKKCSRSEETNLVSEEFRKVHQQRAKEELNTPCVGGIIIWFSVLLTSLIAWLMFKIFPSSYLFIKLNFLSQNQTWLPLFVLIISSLVGLTDDLFQIYGDKNSFFKDGLSRKTRIGIVILIGLICALWFFFKLEMTSIYIPFFGELNLGWLFIPFFVITMLAVFSGGIIDGLDGLSGGIMASIFSAYAGIAFFQNQIDIAAFCAVIAGSILAFLWFNIPPARFYMGETGILGLTTVITVIAFLTKAVAVLPIIAFLLVAASGSAIIQMISKKYFKKKVFRVAPIHHHFEALGWPSYKVTMRFWIIGIVFAIIGMVIALIG